MREVVVSDEPRRGLDSRAPFLRHEEDGGGFFRLLLPPPRLQGQQRSWQHSLFLQLAPRGPDFKLTVVHSWGLYTEDVRL